MNKTVRRRTRSKQLKRSKKRSKYSSKRKVKSTKRKVKSTKRKVKSTKRKTKKKVKRKVKKGGFAYLSIPGIDFTNTVKTTSKVNLNNLKKSKFAKVTGMESSC